MSRIERKSLRTIGLGTCGTVFEVPGTELAYKKGSIAADIIRDFRLTRKVHKAAQDITPILKEAYPQLKVPKTPQCYDYHPPDDDGFWAKSLERFPVDRRSKQPLFTVDRILPIPKAAREALIDLYFDDDEEIQKEAKDDQDNTDCLVRIYFGERESVHQQLGGYDSLRNFPLRLNMMEELDMDISELPKEMALGLAIMHWQAQVDGMDVEFALGSSATPEDSKTLATSETQAEVKFRHHPIHLFMFDFDKARDITLTRSDVTSDGDGAGDGASDDVNKKLVPAFLGNDPYYPRPESENDPLWDDFCDTYLGASHLILESRGANDSIKALPKLFIAGVLKVLGENRDWNVKDNIEFSL